LTGAAYNPPFVPETYGEMPRLGCARAGSHDIVEALGCEHRRAPRAAYLNQIDVSDGP